MDEQSERNRDKVVAKAQRWVSSKRAKVVATVPEKERAQSRHREDGNELAEAVEKFEKSLRQGLT